MSKPIILNERTIQGGDAMLVIHVVNDEVVCNYTNIKIGPLIGILDALKDRLLEQQSGL